MLEALGSIHSRLAAEDSSSKLGWDHIAKSLTSIDTVIHQNHRLLLEMRDLLRKQLDLQKFRRKAGKPSRKEQEWIDSL